MKARRIKTNKWSKLFIVLFILILFIYFPLYKAECEEINNEDIIGIWLGESNSFGDLVLSFSSEREVVGFLAFFPIEASFTISNNQVNVLISNDIAKILGIESMVFDYTIEGYLRLTSNDSIVMKRVMTASKSQLESSGFFGSESTDYTTYISNDFEYIVLQDGTAELTKYTGAKDPCIIPETIDGYTVTSLNGEMTFYTQSYLEDIDVEITKYITSVVIPKTISNIGLRNQDGFPTWLFKDIKYIYVDSENPYFADIDGSLFDKSCTILYKFLNGEKTDINKVLKTAKRIESYSISDTSSV